MLQVVGSTEDVGLEFYDPVQSPFLPQYMTGRNSPYGEQTLLLLQSLAEQQGLHCGRYAELYAATYNGFDGYMNASTVVGCKAAKRPGHRMSSCCRVCCCMSQLPQMPDCISCLHLIE